MESVASNPHQWVAYIDTSGIPHQTQPSFADIGGTATSSQLPIATTSALGAVKPDGTTITIAGDGTITTVVGTAANPSSSIGLTAKNGTATTYMRSDAAPALDQSISPTWTGNHTFDNTIVDNTGVLVGLSSFINGPNAGTQTPLQYANVEIAGNSTNTLNGGNVVQFEFSNDDSAAFLGFAKSRGATKGALAALQSGDNVAEINAIGTDGSNWIDSAYFDINVDGTVSSGIIPMRFAWGSVNSAGVFNEHMRLSSNAILTVGDSVNSTYNLINLNPEPAETNPLIQFKNPSQTNVGVTFETQGNGSYTFDGGGFSPIFAIEGNGATVDNLEVFGATTANPAAVGMLAEGTDANIDIDFIPKGTGTLSLNGARGVICSGTPTVSFATVDGLITHC